MEYAHASSHFFEAVEGHGGNLLFHWNAMEDLYAHGDAIPFVLVAGLILLVISLRDADQKVFISTSVIAVYLFFTVATMKMPSFTLIVCPFLFLGLGKLIDFFFDFLGQRTGSKFWIRFAQPVGVMVVCLSVLDMPRTERQHTLADPDYNNKRSENLAELLFIESIDLPLPDEKYVVFNASLTYFGAIPFMFHRDFAVAYEFMPDKELLDLVKEKKLIPIFINLSPDGAPVVAFFD